MSTARRYANRSDRNSPDHFPVCPRCDEVQSMDGRWCVECGAWLHHDAPTSAAMRARAIDTEAGLRLGFRARMVSRDVASEPPAGEALTPTTGTGS